MSEKPISQKDIALYYKINSLAYRLFHNKSGFVHMGISENGKYSSDDVLVVLEQISSLIQKTGATKILELGTGQGANSFYLAKKFPHVKFVGLDLPNSQISQAYKKTKNVDNFTVLEGDFHDLSAFPSGTFNLVFVIEALCHSDNKPSVAQQVYRVLKSGGLFFVADGYVTDSRENFDEDEELSLKLLVRGMNVSTFEKHNFVVQAITNIGFDVLQDQDCTQKIIPTAQRLEKISSKFLKLGSIAKLILCIFPKLFTQNVVSGYLLAPSLTEGLTSYYLTTFKKIS